MPYALAAGTLWQREIVRFFRQRSRVIGAIVPPILFWLFIGVGLKSSFHIGGLPAAGSDTNYIQYLFPGTIAMIVLFTAIFSTISIIEDRHEGFLQSVMVAPVPRGSIVLGKIAGGSTLAFLQGLLFICLAPVVGIQLHAGPLIYMLLILFLVSFSLTGLGFIIAWKLDSTQGFHSIMNLFLMPMWLLSGALFPVSGAPGWLRGIMILNPLTYGVDAMRGSLFVNGHPLQGGVASPLLCLVVTAGFGALMYIGSTFTARKL